MATADPWYEHYANAERALENEDWALVVQEANEALKRKGDSGARVRSYGMNVTAYFPYLQLGIAYYHLGQHDAALQAFETEARLGAIEQSETANANLLRYQDLARGAQASAAAAEQLRIRRIVEQSLEEARVLADGRQLAEAMSALDRALAVAPDDDDAQSAMQELRLRFSEQERERERNQRVSQLVADGQSLLRERRYGEATSAFRQALFLRADPETEALIEQAQLGLAAALDAGRAPADQSVATATGLDEVLAMEAAGQFAAALERLESIIALAPSNAEAISLQRRLLQAKRDAEAEQLKQATIRQLLADADAQLRVDSPEDALSAANRVLALDPGNGVALKTIAEAYERINRKLLGTGPRSKLPPAVRFVDLRQPADDGTMVQTVKTPDFRLNGVIIDNSPVDVEFFDDHDQSPDASLTRQPLGDFYITEFSIESRLAPGLSTFRLVATNSDNLTSSSEYLVVYTRPYYRSPWFYATLLVIAALLAAAPLLRQYREREGLRKRKFNPYVAGAPVMEDDMFFGRRELVDRILQTVHNNSLLIYGERRIGKTSIQHQIKKRLQHLDDPRYEFFPVYVDLQGTPETRFFHTIAEDIFQELSPLLNGLEFSKSSAEEYTYRDFVHDIRAVLRTLQGRTSKQVKLVLLIDEVDELNAYDPRINQKLRSLFMKNFAENLIAVVSGVEIKKQWEREGSPWYNFFEEIEVKPFSDQEARELIERPIARIFKLDRGVVERIIALTAGKPYPIQKICISLVTRLYEQHRRRITVADVNAVAPTGGA